MTTKRSPGARVQSVEAARREEVARKGVTFWVTRDMWCGRVADRVRVWLREPRLTSYWFESMLDDRPKMAGRCVTWSAAFELGEGGASALYCEWPLEACRRIVGTVPDDERQAIRKEGHAGLAIGPLPVGDARPAIAAGT